MKTDRSEQKILKSYIIFGDFNTSLSIIVRTSRQKIRTIEDVNNTIDQLDLFTTERPILTKIVHKEHSPKQTTFSDRRQDSKLKWTAVSQNMISGTKELNYTSITERYQNTPQVFEN